MSQRPWYHTARFQGFKPHLIRVFPSFLSSSQGETNSRSREWDRHHQSTSVSAVPGKYPATLLLSVSACYLINIQTMQTTCKTTLSHTRSTATQTVQTTGQCHYYPAVTPGSALKLSYRNEFRLVVWAAPQPGQERKLISVTETELCCLKSRSRD